jgi:thiamine-phosphate pyrophosphorylase
VANQNQGEAPHFTKELLAGSLKHLREDLEASLSGEAGDDRARSRLEGARRLSLHEIAEEAIPIMIQAEQDVHNLVWPGGLDSRYLALAGVVETLANLSTQLLPHDDKHAHVTDLIDVISRIRLASGTNYRAQAVKTLHGLCVAVRTEFETTRDPAKVIQQVLAGGATTIRLMPGDASDKSYLALAKWAATTCQAAGATVICDGRPDIVRATQAHGVRLDFNDVPLADARAVLDPWQIGGTVAATVEDAIAMTTTNDFIAIGPIFPHRNAPDQPTPALETLREARKRIPADGPPLMVAGGLTQGNVALLAEAGADGVCVGTDITDVKDPKAAAKRTLATFRAAHLSS